MNTQDRVSAASTAVLTGSCKEKSRTGLTFLEAGEAGVPSSGCGDAAVVFTMNLLNSVEKPELLKHEPSSPSSEAQDIMADDNHNKLVYF